MYTLKHATWGNGQILSQKGNRLTVRFEDGSERILNIPLSFTNGQFEIGGELQTAVEAAIHAKQRAEQAQAAADAHREAQRLQRLREETIRAAKRRPRSGGTKRSSTLTTANTLKEAFEAYLIRQDYRVHTPSGNDSTVYSYSKAVDTIVGEEGISWAALPAQIDTIVARYDVGGEKEARGNTSNQTYINALRRFAEFVEQEGILD